MGAFFSKTAILYIMSIEIIQPIRLQHWMGVTVLCSQIYTDIE